MSQADLAGRLAALVGAQPLEWTPRAGGYSTAERYSVALDDGRRVFVKAADAEHMAEWLRREHEVYVSLRGSFIPELIGFDDDGVRPLLVIEDLCHADWAARWTAERVALVRAALDELHASPAAAEHAPACARRTEAGSVAGTPSRRIRSRSSRSACGRARGSTSGCRRSSRRRTRRRSTATRVVHLDVRSDNLCTLDDRAVLVDWNWRLVRGARARPGRLGVQPRPRGRPAAVGAAARQPGFAAFLSGIFGATAGLPPPETAPTVREFQARQLAVALDWVDRDL